MMTCLLQLNANYCCTRTINFFLPQKIVATLSPELESVNDWSIDNKLSLHLGKTQSIVFGTGKRKMLCKCNTFKIVCYGNVIESKATVTYLGVNLDQSLSNDVIASYVPFKTSNKLKFFIGTPESLI